MPQKCPQCGASLPKGVLAGLCPACLLQQGAAADTATHPEAKPFVPLTVEEVARLFPQLEILGFLGKGGMGAVYKARQPALDRLVALKILPAQTAPDPGFAERFTREARALARLSHPNIVAVHEFGQVPSSGAGVPPAIPPGVPPVAVPQPAETPAPLPPAALPYFIMEYVDGVNLRQLQKAGRLSPREALQIVPQICDALQYAHDEGVVHRDIKPENVLIDRKGRVKIADFGLAKIIEGRAGSPLPAEHSELETGAQGTARPATPTHLTEAGQVMGTPHYMAPEQIEHPQAVDHRADIYSLGVVFYEMLTGELPLGKFQPPSRKVQVDVRLDEVVLHALEKEPELRYQHASEVKTDVQTITSSPPPRAGSPAAAPPGISSHDRRGGTRSKLVLFIVLFAAGMLALLLGLVAITLLVFCLSASQGIDAPPGLVGWWRGEGNALDEVGSNDGVLMNGVGFDKGVVGRAFRFKGISYVKVPDAPALRLTEELTIEFWVKRQDLQVVDYIINKGGDYTHGALNYGVCIDRAQSGSKLGFTFAGGFRRSSRIADLNWHHVAVVARNGDEDPTFYVDGVEQPVANRGGSPNINLYPSTEPLQIGAQVDPDKAWDYHSRAVVDEVSIYNRALAAAEIHAIFAAGSHGKRKPAQGLAALISAARRRLEPGPSRPLAATRPPGLVGWWRGEGNANDSAGTNNGTLIGEATYTSGKVGQAFSFHPDSGTVLVPDSPSLRLTKEFTIEAWINTRSVSDPGGYAVVGKVGIGTGNNGYQLVVVGDTLHGLFNSPGTSWPSQRIISEPLFSPGVWYHVAFTYDQSAMKLYCNGQLVATSDIGAHPIATSSSDFRISGADDHCYFDGMVDEVAVYNRALSATEIEADFATAQNGKRKSGQGRFAIPRAVDRQLEPSRSRPVAAIAPPPGLVSWWRGEGDASDSAGTNNGVLQGGVAFVAGEVGQAFSFDGSSDSYVEVADSPTLRFPNALTIECWAKRLNTSECHELVEKGGTWNGGQTDFGIGLNDTYSGGSHFGFSFAGGWRGCPVVPDTAWHHYAAVAVSGQANPILYIDGVPQTIIYRGGPAMMNLSASTRPLHIGAVVDPQTGWFKYSSTLIDELAIYNRALSASEIQAIFAAGPAGKLKASRGLLGAFLRSDRLPENSGSAASPASALPDEWSPSLAPGQKLDPNKVRDEANELRAKGQYQEALDRFLWYWNHALEYDSNLSAVRLSFLLSDWIELGRRYPKAKQTLLDARTRDTQMLLNRRGDFDRFMELASLNQYLQEEQATYEVFNKLRQRDPALAWQCFFVAQPLLVKHGDYALCLEYLGGSEPAFSRIHQQWQMRKRQEQGWEGISVQTADTKAGSSPPPSPKTADRRFVDETCQLILILVKTDRKTEAEHILDEALGLVDDPRLKSAVSDAEPEPARK